MTMAITQILSDAKEGKRAARNPCPWNPRRLRDVAFGKSGNASCDHGLHWHSVGKAISMTIVRDPGGTTPHTQKTEILCFVCNSRNNPSDKTAKHAFDLWRAAVALSDSETGIPYLNEHYWTNAVMHSAVDKGVRDKQLENARGHCKGVLQDQIRALSPRVIIASGEQAVNSLYDNGLLAKDWSAIVHGLGAGVYAETASLASDYKVGIYCTCHTGITAVNCTVAQLYDDDTTKSELLQRRRMLLPEKRVAFDAFLDQWYPPKMNATGTDINATSKGMRVLLLHWLNKGEAIRQARIVTPSL